MNLQPHRICLIFLSICLIRCIALAQSSGNDPGSNPPETSAGWESGGYLIHQSIEAGYRISDTTGSSTMYDTLVNLQTGPRILTQSLSMHSTTHESLLFDNLFTSSFGWGGDPSNGLRFRIDKSKWYDFRANFMRDQNYFDYNLLANPLNPSTSSPYMPILFSPHSFETTRRMSNLDLTLLPLSRFSFRVGYSRNNMTGSSYSSLNNGAVALLSQPWNTTLNSYRFGVDYKFLPHTVISYDQFLDYYKGDTSWQVAPFIPALLPGTSTTVALGLPFNTVGGTPCSPPAGQPLIDAAGTLTNIACNGYLNYNRSNIVRTSMSTERVSLHSNYFERLDLSASYAYSSADMNAPLDEFFNGLVSRSETRQSTDTGPAEAKRISNVADLGSTFHLTKHWRLVETFRFWSYRIPQNFNLTETDWIVPVSSCAPPACSLLTPISSTVPSVSTQFDQLSFNQNWTRNQVDLIWDASKHFGGRVGFRYDDRAYTNLDLTTGDEDHIVIHGYTALLGFWARPKPNLRFNFNWEHTNNDNSIVLIGSRKESRYRILANYTPTPWAVLGASMNLWQNSNGNAFTDYRGHNRNYGFTASLSPKEHLGFDVAFNYSDYLQNAFICFNDADTSLAVVANAGSCTANGYNDSKNPLLTYGYYTNQTYYAMGAVVFRPIRRVTAQLGYSIISVAGETPQFNILQPLGSLQYNYNQPLANFAVDIGHNVTARAGWNYYQYGEDSFVGPTAPRYFHANNTTLGLRWAF
jgi:hypothetical protein